ncbi:C4-dicarboxylate transporter DcuC, partial [Desulfovibrio sp. OttesenSCG-928-I05]|nr:C4-dicarboxylate transporter DcuC [Desulfovibrio sp. OttesenSCG-928-I05]
MVGVLLGVVVLFITGYLILTKAKAQAVLLTSGILLMAMGAYLGTGTILDKSTGSVLLDIYEKIRAILSSRGGGLGLSIMAVAGYARFMDKNGASRAMVRVLSAPLQKLSSPYLVMSATYILGQVMAQFITSASGLGMLLMVTLYPTLISLGVSRLSAVAAIGTTMGIEWGIMESNTIYAAEVAGMPVSQYFMDYQLLVGCTVILSVAVTHFFVQRWFDSKAGPDLEMTEQVTTEDRKEAPLYYAILPTLPLLLLIGYLVFDSGREVHLVTVIMISITICMLVDFFHGFR